MVWSIFKDFNSATAKGNTWNKHTGVQEGKRVLFLLSVQKLLLLICTAFCGCYIDSKQSMETVKTQMCHLWLRSHWVASCSKVRKHIWKAMPSACTVWIAILIDFNWYQTTTSAKTTSGKVLREHWSIQTPLNLWILYTFLIMSFSCSRW